MYRYKYVISQRQNNPSMRFLLLVTSLLFATLTASAQLEWVPQHPGTITYTLDLANVQQHELRITVDFPAVGPGIFRVKMPQSSPGRYAQHNFAKNVYDLRAFGADGAAVDVYQEGIAEWAVAGHGGAVTLEYTLFANGGDGTYSGIDDRKLHLNMPASFLYGDVLNDRPVLLKIKDGQRTDWTVATQLVEVGTRAFAAPNYYYFFDSPTIVGTIMRDQFEVKNPDGTPQTIEVAMMHEGTREQFDDYVAWTKDIVLAQQKVYGEIPAFDYGKYTFLCAYNPWIGGDSGELWFAEGFTSYYDDLSLVRAGILSPEDYADGLAGQLNYVLLRPGRDHRNAIEMSQQAPFVDAATANDPDNFGNTFVSYYPYGATIGLALDLTLRERGHTLDEVMKLIWQRYGKTEIPYHIRDLQLALGEVVGDQAWAKDWFADYVYKSDLPNIGALLDNYGFMVEPAQDTVSFMGLRLRENDGTLTVRGTIAENSPLYAAGLDGGSTITSLNGQAITSQATWDAAVSDLEAGKSYELGFTQLGREKTGRFTASVSPQLKIRFEEGKRKMKKAREGWLWVKE